jgi:hypothetical protein
MSTSHKNCRRCGRPVEVYAADYDTFEGMHWLCFHLQFEHQADPDAPCADIGCPWTQIKVFREKLIEIGIPPDKLLEATFHGLPFQPSSGA